VIARVALIAAVSAALCGCGASTRPPAKLLGLGTYMSGRGDGAFEATRLLSLDPRTLRPVGALKLGDAVAGGATGSTFVFSPDHGTLVFGGYNFGELLFVDPSRLKMLRRLKVVKLREPSDADIEIAGWPRRDLLVAVSSLDGAWWAPHPAEVLLIDAGRGRVIRRVPVRGAVDGGTRTRDGTVVLLRTPATSGGVERGIPALVTVSPRGRIRTLPLPSLNLDGRERVRLGDTTFRAERTAAIATDGNRRVFVVAAGRPIAEVDVPTLSVRYHRVRIPDIRFSAPPLLPGTAGVHLRFSRGAAWLGGHLLAISGEDELPAEAGDPILGHRLEPIRVQLLDTSTWRIIRSFAAIGCEPAGELVLCSGGVRIHGTGADAVQTGLVAYDRHWRVRYRRPAPTYWSLTAGRLFAARAQNRVVELDLRTGTRLRRVRPPDSWLPYDLAVWRRPD
jgi:hypothetical protein